ncbi:hypothetical protein ACQ4PT_007087 [Festuca glaucescens]|jgi:hypothetical protein
MGFCCGPSDVRVLPKNTSSSPSPPSSINGAGSDGKKKQPQRQRKQQGVKSEQVKEKKKGSNLDRAALTTPQFPFHSRPGLM